VTSIAPAATAPRPDRLRAAAQALRARVSELRAHPLLNPIVARELWSELRSRHPVATEERTHLSAAIDWLARAQDVHGDGGIARGYSLVWQSDFMLQGWQPNYPETTGYTVPTLYTAARVLDRPDLAARAERAARWGLSMQLPSGGVRGGIVTQRAVPVVFNTGQVLFGWLAAYQVNGDGAFADAAISASRFLVRSLDPDGVWRRHQSPFANMRTTLYNARTAWALAEAGVRLGYPVFVDAARRALQAVVRHQLGNGWLPSCCLTDAERPLLHTLAYAINGLVDGGRVLEYDAAIQGGARAAERVAESMRADGFIPGRFTRSWDSAVPWSCLTGNAQMALVWMSLYQATGDQKWLSTVEPVLEFLKSTQNRTTQESGIRGGIKGAFPLTGDYGRLQILSWATKFFADALMRHMYLQNRAPACDVASLA
jgi:uncharacterized protein YyaL (SSP411 family)